MAWNKLFYFLLLLEIIHMIVLGHFLEMEPERESCLCGLLGGWARGEKLWGGEGDRIGQGKPLTRAVAVLTSSCSLVPQGEQNKIVKKDLLMPWGEEFRFYSLVSVIHHRCDHWPVSRQRGSYWVKTKIQRRMQVFSGISLGIDTSWISHQGYQ